MGQLLDDIFRDIKQHESIEQIKMVCDQIKKEELSDIKYDGPIGPTIFLSLPAYEDKTCNYYFTLERVAANGFTNILYKRNKKEGSKLLKIREILNTEIQPKKIILNYAGHLKFFKEISENFP